uniref:Uncharacterized protein n=1 Tax=viral metagenome TaxID=1070528 RepID=A0A6H2A6U1_9ZZZZ
MSNLKKWIEDEAEGEEIEAIVIGEMGWGDYNSDTVPNYDNIPKGKILTWEEAKQFIDYNFDIGYGAPKCNAIIAWTKSKVITIGQYDGATWPYSLPRNPVDTLPTMEGG